MANEDLISEVSGMLVRIGNNYARETSAPGTRFEGRTLESVQAEAVIRRVRERIYAELGNDHYVTFTHGRWTIEHSVECRLSGHMSECAYHEAVATAADDFLADWGGGTLGRWRITGISEGLPDLERADREPPP